MDSSFAEWRRSTPAARRGLRRRHAPGRLVTARTAHPFPLGILAINLAGTLALGLVAGAALEGDAML